MRFLSKECLKYACGAVLAASLAFAPTMASAAGTVTGLAAAQINGAMDSKTAVNAVAGTPGTDYDNVKAVILDADLEFSELDLSVTTETATGTGGTGNDYSYTFTLPITTAMTVGSLVHRELGDAFELYGLQLDSDGTAGTGGNTEFSVSDISVKPTDKDDVDATVGDFWFQDSAGALIPPTTQIVSGTAYQLVFAVKNVITGDPDPLTFNTDQTTTADLVTSIATLATALNIAPHLGFDDEQADKTSYDPDALKAIVLKEVTAPTGISLVIDGVTWTAIDVYGDGLGVEVTAAVDGKVLTFAQDFEVDGNLVSKTITDALKVQALGMIATDFKPLAAKPDGTALATHGYFWVENFAGDAIDLTTPLVAGFYTVFYGINNNVEANEYNTVATSGAIKNATRVIYNDAKAPTPPTPAVGFKANHFVGVKPTDPTGDDFTFAEGTFTTSVSAKEGFEKTNLSVVSTKMGTGATSLTMAMEFVVGQTGDLLDGEPLVDGENANITLEAFTGATNDLNVKTFVLIEDKANLIFGTFYVGLGDIASVKDGSVVALAKADPFSAGAQYVVVFMVPDAKSTDTANVDKYKVYDSNLTAEAITTTVQLELKRAVAKLAANVANTAVQPAGVFAKIDTTTAGATSQKDLQYSAAKKYVATQKSAAKLYDLEEVKVTAISGQSFTATDVVVFNKLVTYAYPAGVTTMTLTDTTFGITKFGTAAAVGNFGLIERKALADPADLNGKFWVVAGDNPTTIVSLAKGATITPGVYTLFYGIKNNDPVFDANNTNEVIADPNQAWANAAAIPDPTPSTHKSSGCTVGTGSAYDLAFLFLALMGMVAFRAVARKNS